MSSTRANLFIKGLVIRKDESIDSVVTNFFKEKMGIQETIPIAEAYKINKKDKNTIIKIELSNQRDRGKIFKHVKNLKDCKNEFGKAYHLDLDLPPKSRAARNRLKEIRWENANKSSVDQHTIEPKKGNITIDGETYVKAVKPPCVSQILKASKEARLQCANLQVVRGNRIEKGSSVFLGYSADIRNLTEVNEVHAKICGENLAARHVVCAFRLPNRNFVIHEDFNNDDEDGMGAHLLQILRKSNIMNKVVFVVCFYDGTHIGNA